MMEIKVTNDEQAVLSYEISEKESKNDLDSHNNALIDKSDHYIIRADKTDYLVAASSGILVATLDALWVGEFSLYSAQEQGTQQIENFVITIAQKRGCRKNDIKGCIKYLEEMYPMASDKLTNVFGGSLQHHLRDFSHHASPFGLICSILNQFTNKGVGTDRDGNIITPKIPISGNIGNTFEEKIMFGVVGWFYHLVSDMAGSSGSNGRGTGIPGPMLSMAKILSTTRLFKDLGNKYKDDELAFSLWVSKLFNGTAFKHSDQKDIIRFDLRTELGIGNFALKQSIPVIINQIIIRVYYFLRRLSIEYPEAEGDFAEKISKVKWSRVLPFENPCVVRMITISTGTFTAIDSADSIIRAKLNNELCTPKVLLRINFIGIGAFAFAVRDEAKQAVNSILKLNRIQNIEYAYLDSAEIKDMDIQVEMDNSGLYDYAFKCMYNHVVDNRRNISDAQRVSASMYRPLLDIADDDTDLYDAIARVSQHALIVETEDLIMRLFKLNNIVFNQMEGNEKYSLYMPFTRIIDGKRVGYIFSTSMGTRVDNWKEILNKYSLDNLAVVSLVDVKENTETLNLIVGNEERLTDGKVSYLPIQTLFNWIGDNEYSVYKSYCDQFNESVRKLIGYRTVTIPSESMLATFKLQLKEKLSRFDYYRHISDLYDFQIEIISRNYIEQERYKVIIGNSEAAESFLSAEWYYQMHNVTSGLEQTAIVAGYFKSIEQLLYKIVLLWIDRGTDIKAKGSNTYIPFASENIDDIDFSLGSLIGYMKHYQNVWSVNRFARYYISNKLSEYRQRYRNDHLHKDNVYDIAEEEIRIHTILLFYLVLGGCELNEDQIISLSPYHDKKIYPESLKYEELEEWLNSILGGDNLLDDRIPVWFSFARYGGDRWRLEFNTFKKLVKHEAFIETFGAEYPYVCDTLMWAAVLDEEVAEQDVLKFLSRYLEDGKYSAKLKRHSLIVAGKFGYPKTIYRS